MLGGHRTVENSTVCCSFFWSGFQSSDRRQYSESLSCTLGVTALTIIDGSEGTNHRVAGETDRFYMLLCRSINFIGLSQCFHGEIIKFTTVQSQFSVSRPHSDFALPFYKASLYENEHIWLSKTHTVFLNTKKPLYNMRACSRKQKFRTGGWSSPPKYNKHRGCNLFHYLNVLHFLNKIYLKIQTFLDVSPSRQANTHRHFEVLQCLHVQGGVLNLWGYPVQEIGLHGPDEKRTTILCNVVTY